MSSLASRELRQSLSVFINKSTHKALIILLADIAIYISAFCGVVLFDSVLLKFICSCIVGLKMASLFVIGHDAAHDSFVNNSLLNKIIARLAFLPCYHNYSLWLIVHNRYHHQLTNMKDVNSWSPLSKQEFDNVPIYRKALERLYRCPLGIPFNYLIERWWKNKFFPFKRLTGVYKRKYWFDFTLVLSYLLGQVSFLTYLGLVSVNNTVIEMVVFGFIQPLIVFAFMVGFSVYQQHTHESVAWFDNQVDKKTYGYVEDVTIHVKYPHWYNVLSHNVMEHTAHHVDPRIPSYNLGKAQTRLVSLYGDRLISIGFSLNNFLQTMKKCKLYDYENHCWLNFNGVPTTACLIKKEDMSLSYAA